MQDWITQVLGSSRTTWAALPAGFLLGLIGAVTSGCSLAVAGAIAGYSGDLSRQGGRRAILLGALFFMIGTTVALAALGAVTGLISQAVGAVFGIYWKLFAGVVLIVFGLATLRVLPFSFRMFGSKPSSLPRTNAMAIVYGLAIGGGLTTCAVACNPALYMALGLATLQGRSVWGAAVMAAFALGYSLPLAAAVVGLGLGLGRLSRFARWAAPVVKVVAGALLIASGFYLLATL